MNKLVLTLVFTLMCLSSNGKIWKIGPAKTYTKPSQVSTLVGNGDTVEIDAGTYTSDVAKWTANNLLLKGVGGLAHLKSNGSSSGGKAIWVIGGNDNKVEYVEFSLCAVVDHNGAGIRQEGKNLTVSHCYFHHNENGILAGTTNPSKIVIEYSEFAFNGFGDGLSHNLYINHIDTLIFRYNYSHNAIVGHELKSRANVNYILYNRLSDETASTASRSIDLPNGGGAYIIGNVIEQGPQSQNSNIVGYGLEGLTNSSPSEVFAINNTIVNNKSNGSFFQFFTGTLRFKGYNNILVGPGTFVTGSFPSSLDTASNIVLPNVSSYLFKNATNYDFGLTSASKVVIDKGTNPGSANGFSLNPTMEYLHSAGTTSRCNSGNLDIGAYEYCAPVSTSTVKTKQFILYPNPANKTITFLKPLEAVSTLEIYTIEGKLIFKTSELSYIDISAFSNGIYFAKLNCGNEYLISKFYIAH